MERLLLRIEDAAKVLSVSRSALYQLIASGDMSVVHINRSARVPAEILSAYVARLQQEQNQAAQ
jgi:excisionase family DNA binding protein